jgi:hypothetical protein
MLLPLAPDPSIGREQRIGVVVLWNLYWLLGNNKRTQAKKRSRRRKLLIYIAGILILLAGALEVNDSFAADQEIGWPIKVGTRAFAFSPI